MMPNILFVALAALVPLVMGFIYYNPKVFGNAWMKAANLTEEQLKGNNMIKVFGTMLVLSFIMSGFLFMFVVHQTDYYSILIEEPGFGEEGSAIMNEINTFMANYGDRFRTFKHGALHGGMIGAVIALPVLLINGLFETKNFKYGLINGFFWILCFTIMGGILCQWA